MELSYSVFYLKVCQQIGDKMIKSEEILKELKYLKTKARVIAARESKGVEYIEAGGVRKFMKFDEDTQKESKKNWMDYINMSAYTNLLIAYTNLLLIEKKIC